MKNEKEYQPNSETIIASDGMHEVYYYCNDKGVPIFKTKEFWLEEKRFIFYPYSIDISDGSVKSKRINSIEFLGWETINNIPDDFKTENKYGLRKLRTKAFFNVLYSKFKDVRDFTIGINIENSFRPDHIDLNWTDVKIILSDIGKEKNSYDKEKTFLINKHLFRINNRLSIAQRYIPAGDLQRFLSKYDSFEKINSNDLNALSAVMDYIPPTLIQSTANFINSKEKINKIYIEETIATFEKLMSATKDNEKQWQNFFEKNAWTLSHIFPYEVILNEREAYVGGKTLGNKDGRIVDFLFANGFKDNFALLEFKTHNKSLLKSVVYRKPAVFAMSDDLSGGIAQCLDQKDVYIKDFGNKNPMFDPKCILVIGQKQKLTEPQKKCFELIRSNQKAVDIVTFDEIIMKLKGLLKVLSK
ncbi:Shedu immune nuclease family protein [Pedobacter sp. MR22-3]|uniref:Shedu immune nuclease family protein n=1 Tax=Pedobacter sp. MR22-3 TaxID=2994552 RepID=UPI0022459818|nr:Shedu immune nuclease family protein [Pedobacter sp. MR22-3]MCX2583989.1 DUF4263 domain-containing protein [Pedobacter sp. MR22-3]